MGEEGLEACSKISLVCLHVCTFVYICVHVFLCAMYICVSVYVCVYGYPTESVTK